MPGENMLAVILAGGMGERLRPLTEPRAKPAVPFGGIYRIIDFTLSNCVNSGLRQILVLTQYKSHSLSNHLKTGWNFLSRRLDQYIDEIPAQMQSGKVWYTGTAHAIRQNMGFIEDTSSDLVLILSGDHVYKMDYRLMSEFHREKRAAATVSTVRVPADIARGAYGVLEVDEDSRIVSYVEKPENPETLPGTSDCLASMGIYIFDMATLKRVTASGLEDFGKHVLPEMVASGEDVYAYDFSSLNRIEEYEVETREDGRVERLVERSGDSGYWRDVGTLESYWRTNLALVAPQPTFNLYGQRWPFFNYPVHFPPAKFVHSATGRTGVAIDSIVADGVIVSGGVVRRSVISPGTFIDSHTRIESSILLGGSLSGGIVDETSIGRNCRIRNAIIDKSCRVPDGTVIGYDQQDDERAGLWTQELDSGGYLVVVPKAWNRTSTRR